MGQEIYTNYWVNVRNDVKKEHGSYPSEEEAFNGIQAWWDIHKEAFRDVEKTRTNSGALEIHYGDDNYYYRIEKNDVLNAIPPLKVKKRTQGEIDRIRQQHQLDSEAFLFEELAEPYQDRLQLAFHDGDKLKEYTFDIEGRPITKYNN